MGINLTEAAVKELKSVQDEQNLEDNYVRIGISAGGCSGFSYMMNFIEADEFDEKQDKMLEQDGLKVVVDKKSMLYLDGTIVGWHSDLTHRGFTFENPNSKNSCGCGKSFNA